VVTPHARQEQVLLDAHAKAAKEADESLDAWEEAHRARITKILIESGFED
jgi:hypothetical protein